MPPTLVEVIGFEARADTQTNPSGSPYWDAVTGSGLSYVAGRLGGWALKITEDGLAATTARRNIASTTDLIVTLYGWGTTPLPTTNSDILSVSTSTGGMVAHFALGTSGNLRATAGFGTAQVGPVVTDGLPHRLDAHINTNGATWTVDWYVDGVAQTQATVAGTAGTGIARIVFGSSTNAHNATWTWDDCILSVTPADFPMSQFIGAGQALWVQRLTPNLEGSDHPDIGVPSNAVTLTGAAQGYQVLDELATGSAAAGTYVSYTSITTGGAAQNYFEVQLTDKDPLTTEVWAVSGAAACSSAAAGTNNLTVRVMDLTGVAVQLTDIVSGSTNNATAISYYTALVSPPPSGWMNGLNNARIRVGISSDTNPLPRCHAVVLEAATLAGVAQTVTIARTDEIGAALTPQIIQGKNVVLGRIDDFATPNSINVLRNAVTFTNTFDAALNGTTVTVANSTLGGQGDDAFGGVTIGAGSTLVYDTTTKIHGPSSAAFDPAAAVTDYVEWRPTAFGEWYGRLYVNFSVLPPNAVSLVMFRDSATATNRGVFTITATGQVRMVNGAGTTVDTTTATLTAGAWSRIEMHWIGDPTIGFMEAKLFNTVESTTPTETITVSNTNTTGTVDRIRVGQCNAPAGDTSVFHLDNLEFNTVGYPGPWFATPQTMTLNSIIDDKGAPVVPILGVSVPGPTIARIDRIGTPLTPVFSVTTGDQVVGELLPISAGGGWGIDAWGTQWGGAGSRLLPITIQRGINLGFIDRMGTVFAASYNPNFVGLGLIDYSGAHQVQSGIDEFTFTLALARIDEIGTPVGLDAVQAPQTVTIGLIDESPTLFTPMFNAQLVTLGLLNNQAFTYDLTSIVIANQNVTLNLIDSLRSVFAPSNFFQFNGQTVTIPLLDTEAVFELAEVENAGGQTVTLGLIDNTPTVPTLTAIRPLLPIIQLRARYNPIQRLRGHYVPVLYKRARRESDE